MLSTVPTTSTTIAPTTSPPVEAVEEFVAAFAAAVEAEDFEFLFERLHPVVVDIHDEQLCRDFIEREIVELSDYRLIGDVTKTERRFDTSSGSVLVDPFFTAPIHFVFEGKSFVVDGADAPVDGEMGWFTEYR